MTGQEDLIKKRFAEEQTIAVLRESEVGDVPIKVLCERHNISEQTFFRWRNKYGRMDAADARRLKDLEAENARLKRFTASAVMRWPRDAAIGPAFIASGSPWQNGFVESFNGKLCDELHRTMAAVLQRAATTSALGCQSPASVRRAWDQATISTELTA